jgi:hypothetical protein
MAHNSSISQIMSHDYLKSALEERVNRNALDAVVSKLTHNKDNLTKAEKLRSKSVARVLKKYEYDEQIEGMKRKKASQNDISFSQIEKSAFKFKKELSLPPIGNSPGSSRHLAVPSIGYRGATELSVIPSQASQTTPGSPIGRR